MVIGLLAALAEIDVDAAIFHASYPR